jgi:Leucine-rich repeat (LRR) protein
MPASVDLSGNNGLTYLDLSDNEIPGMDFSNLTALETFDIRNNLMTGVRIPGATNLTSFKCEGNPGHMEL